MKLRTLITGVLASALALTGCAMGGAPAPKAAPTLENSTGPVTGEITVWTWDVAATALKRLATDYEKSHQGTTIKVVDVGYDNAYDKISVGLQAGTGLPDLLTLETDRLPGFLENFPNGFVDLTSRVEPEKANLDPSKLAAATGKDGKILAMPWDSGTMALYLRSDYLSDAGIDPATLTTWDAFAKAAEQVKAKLGKTAFDTDLSTGAMFLQLLQQRGTGIFDANGKVILDNDKAVAVLTFLQGLQQKGLINNTKGWDARVSAAKAGKSAFSPNAVWWTGTLTSEAKELKGKWRVQPLPTFAEGEAKTSNNGGSNLAIPAQAKNPALAADFAAFALLNSDNQNSMMADEGLFPSYLPALASPVYSEPDPYFGGQPAMRVFADLTSTIPAISYTGDYAKASEIVANATVEAILNGKDAKATLQDAAATIAKQTNREIG